MSKKKAFLILFALILAIGTVSLFVPKELEATIYGTVKGRVIAEDTGKGVEGVVVRLIQTKFRFEPKIWKTKTDKNGYFSFDMVKEEKYFLHFTPPAPYIEDTGFVRYLRKSDYPGQTIIVEKGKIIYFEKVVRVGGSISGTVYIKENGNIRPYPKASVIASWETDSKSLETDSFGQYRIEGLDPNYEYIVKVFIKNEFAVKRKERIIVSKNQDTSGIDFIFDLDDRTGIEGTVTSSVDGSPIMNASISVSYMNSNFDIAHIDVDDKGKYSILGMEPGLYEVAVLACGKYGIDKYIAKENIYVEKGKTTIVNFSVDCSSN